MSARSLLLVFLHCVFVVSVLGAVATRKKLDWSCRNITPPSNFTVSLLEGNWLVARTVEREKNTDSAGQCHRLKYSKLNSTTILAEGSGSTEKGYFTIRDAKKPWILVTAGGDSTMNVIHISEDASKLVVTFCLPNSIGKGYYVFAKSTPISDQDVRNIESIVDGAGGTRSSKTEKYHTWQATATCSKKI